MPPLATATPGGCLPMILAEIRPLPWILAHSFRSPPPISPNGVDRIPLSFEVLTSTDGVTFNVVAGPSPVTDFGTDAILTMESSFAPTPAKFVEFDFGQFSGIDPANGGTGGGSGQGAGIYQLSVEAVPESSTWAMMGIGFAGLAFAGYRTSRKAVSTAA